MNRSEAGKLGAVKTRQILLVKRDKKIKEYNLNPKTCKLCKEAIPYKKKENKFCNHSCAATFNNNGKIKKKRNYCLFCNKETKNEKYCNHFCQHNFHWDKKCKLIKTNSNICGYKSIKKFLIQENGIKCEICNLEKWNGKEIPLDLDHIDGNSQNNTIENCRLICPNCHAQTPTYKGKNIGNGRAKRRQRYRDGKSY